MNDSPIRDERLAAWVDEAMSPEERAEFERAMAADPDLRAAALEYQATVAKVRASLATPLPPSNLTDSILAAVDQTMPSPVSPPRLRLLPLLGSLAAAAALVFTVVLIDRRGQNTEGERTELSRGWAPSTESELTETQNSTSDRLAADGPVKNREGAMAGKAGEDDSRLLPQGDAQADRLRRLTKKEQLPLQEAAPAPVLVTKPGTTPNDAVPSPSEQVPKILLESGNTNRVGRLRVEAESDRELESKKDKATDGKFLEQKAGGERAEECAVLTLELNPEAQANMAAILAKVSASRAASGEQMKKAELPSRGQGVPDQPRSSAPAGGGVAKAPGAGRSAAASPGSPEGFVEHKQLLQGGLPWLGTGLSVNELNVATVLPTTRLMDPADMTLSLSSEALGLSLQDRCFLMTGQPMQIEQAVTYLSAATQDLGGQVLALRNLPGSAVERWARQNPSFQEPGLLAGADEGATSRPGVIGQLLIVLRRVLAPSGSKR